MRTVERCPACDHSGPEVVAILDAAKRERFIEFDRRKYGGVLQTWLEHLEPVVLCCPICGHCWYRNQPEQEQLAQMYGLARSIIGRTEAPPREPSAQMLAETQKLRSVVGDVAKSPTLLDYGSGFGRWARAAVKVGFEVVAFEPSLERGSETHMTPFELVHELGSLRGRRFDAIQLEQVLEHVVDPFATLQSLHELCHPRTVIRATVPNLLRSPEGRRMWELWPFDGHSPHTLAPFEHLHGFTPRSLRTLTSRAGFRPLSQRLVVRHYPRHALRRILGAVRAEWDSTFQLLVPGFR